MIGLAVLGCGRIGRVHARNIRDNSRARLVSCYDVAGAAADAMAADLGCERAPSVEAVLSDPRVRAVLVASSTDTHVDLVTRAAQAGRAVLCEKPIDLDLARVEACGQAIAGSPGPVMVGFNRRFDPSFRALRDRLAAGEVGAVEQVTITSRDPSPPPPAYVAASGGLFRDMTIHDFDMARFLVGDIAEVQAMSASLLSPAIGDVDAAMVVMRARSGALVHISNSRHCAYGYDQRIEAFGANGMLQAHNRHATTVEAWGSAATRAADPVQDFFTARYAEAYRAELDHFLECVETGAAPLAGFAEGREALRLADAALESAASGRVVQLP